jgi:hypothetical protein
MQVALKRSGQSATQSKAKYLVKLLWSKDAITFAHFLTNLGVLTKFFIVKSLSNENYPP